MIKRPRNLADVVGQDILVRLDRKPLNKCKLMGYVVGLSNELLLLHVVDGNTLALDGYRAVRVKSIRRWREDGTFVHHALQLLGRTPVAPEGIDLTDWPSLLMSANERYPVVMIEREQKLPGKCAVGRVAKVGKRALTLEEIDPDACWSETERLKRVDITCVSFGDGYTQALAALDRANSDERRAGEERDADGPV